MRRSRLNSRVSPGIPGPRGAGSLLARLGHSASRLRLGPGGAPPRNEGPQEGRIGGIERHRRSIPRTLPTASLRDPGYLVPGEGFEPPTFGLQNRCTATVLTRPIESFGGGRTVSNPALPLSATYHGETAAYRRGHRMLGMAVGPRTGFRLTGLRALPLVQKASGMSLNG